MNDDDFVQKIAYEAFHIVLAERLEKFLSEQRGPKGFYAPAGAFPIIVEKLLMFGFTPKELGAAIRAVQKDLKSLERTP